MDALTTKLEGFDAMMQKILDKVTGLEAWKTAADASMDALISKANATATHLRRLEVPPPPLQAASTAYSPPPPPAWVNPFDLNLAPRQAARPSASALERPSGHPHDSSHRDAGGGILGSHPRHPVTGTSNSNPQQPREFFPEHEPSAPRSRPKPKIEFPEFDGQNPRVWKERCELYFEV
jgi:hypothetical protein